MSHISGKETCAMDSAPCPACDRNKNGIFSVYRNGDWHCQKCDATFQGPTPDQCRDWRQLAIETDVEDSQPARSDGGRRHETRALAHINSLLQRRGVAL